MKRRILIANDASFIGSGYGVYGKELLSRLQKTGKYEIAEIACYANSELIKHNRPAWLTYPGIPEKDAPKEVHANFRSNPRNSFGAWSFHSALIDFKPDIVFDIRDYWMYSFEEVSSYRPFYKWVVMPTVDSAPQKTDWLNTFSTMDLVVPYTEWAYNTLNAQCGNSINLFPEIANAGVDLDAFKPLSEEDKKLLKKQAFGDEDLLITGCVMRNQKRKLFPNLLKSYRMYLNELLNEGKQDIYDKSYLYIHTTWPEHNGWDLPGLLLEHGMLYKTYFTSICSNCKASFATKFHEQSVVCSQCNKQSVGHPVMSHSLDTETLVKVYQSMDFFLQIAICEGFGMPQVEAAACGVPIASVDYSAMSEIVRKLEGHPILVEATFRELETGADRVLPSNADIACSIYDYFKLSDEQRKEKSKRTRELCEKHYSWDAVADVWDRALSSVSLENKLDWNMEKREVDLDMKVPASLEGLEMVEYIVKNIIKDDYLLYTAPIQAMIRQATTVHYGKPVMEKAEVVKFLQEYIKNKQSTENIRTQKNGH